MKSYIPLRKSDVLDFKKFNYFSAKKYWRKIFQSQNILTMIWGFHQL